jgi:peptidyl-prolyl cis-trans isomerase D
MLNVLRKQAQSTLIQGLVLVIAIVFIFWGVGSNMNNNRNAVATVNDNEITYQNYQRAYEQAVDNLQQQFGGQVPPGLLEGMGIKQQVLGQLIQAELLRQGGEEMGIVVSDLAVQNEIDKIEVFQRDGNFDLSRYKSVLSQNRMTTTSYEGGLKADLQRRRVTDNIGSFAMVSDNTVQNWLAYIGEEIQFSYVIFEPSAFEDMVEVKDNELASWFEINKEKYRSEPKIRLKYLFFSYDEDGKQKASGLTFKRASKTYEDIMRAGSLDKYGQMGEEKVITTDFFSRSEPPEGITADAKFLEAAFSLNKGELSSLVELADGYTIVFVDDVQEPALPELNAVRKRVVVDYKKEKAVDLAAKAADDFLAVGREKGSLKSASGSDFQVKSTNFLKRSAPVAKDSLPSQVVQDGFTLSWKEKLAKNPVQVGNTYYVYEVTERRLSTEKVDDTERQQIHEQLLASAQNELITSWLSRVQKHAKIWTNDTLLK